MQHENRSNQQVIEAPTGLAKLPRLVLLCAPKVSADNVKDSAGCNGDVWVACKNRIQRRNRNASRTVDTSERKARRPPNAILREQRVAAVPLLPPFVRRIGPSFSAGVRLGSAPATIGETQTSRCLNRACKLWHLASANGSLNLSVQHVLVGRRFMDASMTHMCLQKPKISDFARARFAESGYAGSDQTVGNVLRPFRDRWQRRIEPNKVR